jgi:ATP synthase protein I
MGYPFALQLPRLFIVRNRTILDLLAPQFSAPNRSVCIKKPPLLLIFGVQCVFAGLLIVIFWLTKGDVAALSALYGALIFIAPQQYFAYKSFRYMGARAAVKTVQSFYSAESSKLLLVAVGFALVFSLYKEADVFALMVSFILLVILNGIAPLMLAK